MDDTLKWVQIAANGGAAIMMLVVWFFTMKEGIKNNAEAFHKHAELSQTLIQLLKDEQEYKTMLTGSLNRLELKMSAITPCPISFAGKKLSLEVKE